MLQYAASVAREGIPAVIVTRGVASPDASLRGYRQWLDLVLHARQRECILNLVRFWRSPVSARRGGGRQRARGVDAMSEERPGSA